MKNSRNLKINTYTILAVFALISIAVNGQISKRIDSLALEYVYKGFNGNILYSKNDSILFTGNYGYIDLVTKKPLNDNSLFELASVSKQFTALAIVQLAEKGLLQYETKVYELIERFPYKNITIEHLLRHQSGLPDYQKLLYDKKIWNRKKMATNRDVVKLLTQLKPDLVFDPGSKYDYDNTGYVLLAIIIEQVSGQSYSKYIKEHIFIPSEMVNSKTYSFTESPEDFQNVAKGHTYNKRTKKYQKVEKDKNHKHIHWMNGIVGDRGIYASIIDLEKWKQALKNNVLITKDGWKKMTSIDSVSTKYGYGFAIYNTKSKGKWIYHNGSWSGYKTSAIYLPDSNEYLVILSNNRYKETYKKFEEDLYKLIQ
ncbi:CubicO group peptidase (beta-lactamase class C family) [Saonia flava]|uniref:CubicO group peptidase (Beta-lactamase class C family) n=1 Tax=Saonia flava TaxID=523696 RepID=A0A846QWZ0_9FLAO|nr:serine hydrolase domain-containing protein [Saonia flava]NJB70125.1 CubicO group peptidase (beta-lactamase class C family) [Saonia flava]